MGLGEEFLALSADTLVSELESLTRLLARWRIVHLRVHCQAEGDIDVPYAGSILRGALGNAFFREVCVHRGTPCAECSLLGSCFYPALFEPAPPGDAAPRGNVRRTIVVEPPARIAPGPVEWGLKLFDLPEGALPPLLQSIVEMGERGVGRERVRFAVERIESLAPGSAAPASIYDRADGWKLDGLRRFGALDIAGDPPAASSVKVSLRIRTPLRMRDGPAIRSDLPPERLLRAALRRLTDLGTVFLGTGLLGAGLHGTGLLGTARGDEWPRAWPGILSAAGSMVLDRDETRWLDWGRYSLRQRRPMRLGGIVGELEYSGVSSALVPALRTAAFAHLGKNTSFGLGGVDVEVSA